MYNKRKCCLIFAVDDGVLKVDEGDSLLGGVNQYKLVKTKQVTEEECFRVFRKNKNIVESKQRINNSNLLNVVDDVDPMFQTIGNLTNTLKSNRHFGSHGSVSLKSEFEHTNLFPFSGAYIVPKMFGYFPFLDCDDVNSYTEAKFQLSADNIPYSTYRSSRVDNHYWIFCDRQCSLDEAIDFIEMYPCDHRYPWLARYKRELCIRAIPKQGYAPHHDENNLEDEFSDDFTYWNSQFVKYWDSGLIPSYMDMLKAVESI